MRPAPVSSSSTQWSSASLVTSISLKPFACACRIISAIVFAASVRLCGTLEMRFAPCVGCTKNAFGKPWTWMPCLGAHAGGPMLRQFDAATAGQVEAGAPLVFGADLESRRVDDAV